MRDRELGKKKLIQEYSVSEQRVIRRRWRLAKEKSRAAKCDILSAPPVSPEYQRPHLQEAGHPFSNLNHVYNRIDTVAQTCRGIS